MAGKRSDNKEASGSSAEKQLPPWVEYRPAEIEEVIVSLANAGSTSAEIGMVLRDQYGLPNAKKLTGNTIEEILGKHKLLPEVPRELLNLIRKSVQLEKHMKENKKDFTAKRGYQLTVSKIKRLVKYYHKNGKLAKDWEYSQEKAALLVK